MSTKTWTSDADFNTGTLNQIETATDKLILSQRPVWSFGGDLSLAREYLGGGGVQNATWTAGGQAGAVTAMTEEFDGTSWSSTTDLNVARSQAGWTGLVTAGLCAGGPPWRKLSATTKYRTKNQKCPPISE